MRYVRSLDGIRGIAVLLVVLFHFGYAAFGWVGVQIFFTLSGFLITSILLEDKVQPFPAFIGRFYWRRALRIFPLYFLFLAVAGVSYAVLGLPSSFGQDWPYLATYTANLARARETDLGKSFVHLWSLAVEEQFYLLWPLAVYFFTRHRFKAVVVAILLASPIVRWALYGYLLQETNSHDYAGRVVYVFPFTQFDAFAAGAAIPLFGLERLRHAGRWFLAALALAVVLGLGVLAFRHLLRDGAFLMSLGYPMYLEHAYGYVWGYSLINLLSMLGIICTLQGLPSTRFLAHRPLIEIGKVSYGIYVYHVPLLVAAEWMLPRFGVAPPFSAVRLGVFVIYFACVMLLSVASYRWLESPFLAFKDYWAKRTREALGGRVDSMVE